MCRIAANQIGPPSVVMAWSNQRRPSPNKS
jgi:hypothetical protein